MPVSTIITYMEIVAFCSRESVSGPLASRTEQSLVRVFYAQSMMGKIEAPKGLPCLRVLHLQGAEIIFYGDSIFWEYTGENLNGAPTKADLARKAILDKDFANHSYEVAAIPGVAVILLGALLMHGPYLVWFLELEVFSAVTFAEALLATYMIVVGNCHVPYTACMCIQTTLWLIQENALCRND